MIVLACQVGGCPTDPEPGEEFCRAHIEPISVAPADMESIKGRRCRCTSCDLVAKPRPTFDFYALGPEPHEGKPLLCQRCWYVVIATRADIDPGAS